ncbi:hypothetical protein [Clostridium intestinale]|uniref:Lipoprotein n=1 Tax=Clostridium intestinale TaxID=36845 RepID=A0A7D7A2U3_9CLOT|nr:hypothetical protein [Clostridium intestinale]QLY79458.1 hypothetical protein HZF06_20875 [Clostridium intestinale]
MYRSKCFKVIGSSLLLALALVSCGNLAKEETKTPNTEAQVEEKKHHTYSQLMKVEVYL